MLTPLNSRNLPFLKIQFCSVKPTETAVPDILIYPNARFTVMIFIKKVRHCKTAVPGLLIPPNARFMYDNQVWNLVDQTPGLRTVGCKWIFKKKTDM